MFWWGSGYIDLREDFTGIGIEYTVVPIKERETKTAAFINTCDHKYILKFKTQTLAIQSDQSNHKWDF